MASQCRLTEPLHGRTRKPAQFARHRDADVNAAICPECNLGITEHDHFLKFSIEF